MWYSNVYVFYVEKMTVVMNLPDGYQLKMMGEVEYNMCKTNDWANDLVSQYKDYSAYEKLGLGVVVIKNGELVALAEKLGYHFSHEYVAYEIMGD